MSHAKSTSSASLGQPAVAAIALLLLIAASGCGVEPLTPQPSNVTPFGQSATIIYVPGIGGFGRADRVWLEGLQAGGYEGKTVICDWSNNMGAIEALWNHSRQQSEARRIADRIVELRAESSSGLIILVGHSAGTALAVYALEHLQPHVNVDNLLLLSPALSRTYDLSKALRHVRGRADVFYSNRDTLVLAFGTFLFGTADGVHSESAGYGGFIRPPWADHVAYAMMYAHPYTCERQKAGDDGGHEGVLAAREAAVIIAPLLPRHQVHTDSLAIAGE